MLKVSYLFRNVAKVLFLLQLSLSIALASENTDTTQKRGIIPTVSEHYKMMPMLYDFKNMPLQVITDSVSMRFIIGTESTVIDWELKAGAILPLHHHVNEQITRVDSGELAVYSQGQKFILHPGQIMIFPPNVPHEFEALTPSSIYEIQFPARQDFLDAEFPKKVAASINARLKNK